VAGGIPFSGDLTYDDAQRLQRLFRPRERLFDRVYPFLPTCVVVVCMGGGIVTSIVRGQCDWLTGLSVLIVVGGMVSGLPFLLRWWNSIRERRRHEREPKPKSGVATAEGYSFVCGAGNFDCKWTDYEMLKEGDNLVFLGGNHLDVFVDHMFQSAADWEEFKRFARTGIAAGLANQTGDRT
jgi:hypothetical protein